jgi:hypothetical protein
MGGGDPVATFWSWFTENQARLAVAPPQAAMNEIHGRLVKVNRELVASIDLAQQGARTVEISGNGNRALIPIVKQVVGSAPSLSGWKFVAFRQPSQPGMSIEMNGRTMSFDEVRYVETGSSMGMVDIKVFLPLDPGIPKQVMGEIGFLVLDHTLGEYAVMTQVRDIDFLPIAQAPPDAALLSELAKKLNPLST